MAKSRRFGGPDERPILQAPSIVGHVDPGFLDFIDQHSRTFVVKLNELQALLRAVNPLGHQPLTAGAVGTPGDADEIAVFIGQRQFPCVAGLHVQHPERDIRVLVAGEWIAMRLNIHVVAALMHDRIRRDVPLIDPQKRDPTVLRPPMTAKLAKLFLRDVVGESVRQAIVRTGGQLLRLRLTVHSHDKELASTHERQLRPVGTQRRSERALATRQLHERCAVHCNPDGRTGDHQQRNLRLARPGIGGDAELAGPSPLAQQLLLA